MTKPMAAARRSPLSARVLHGPEPTGIVPRIVQRGTHGWSRRSLAVAGATPSGDVVRGTPDRASAAACDLELWLARLDEFPSDGAAISADESARAARMADPSARARYLASRTLLRRILAARLRCGATDLRFVPAAHGKPVLEAVDPTATADPPVHFNLSHAGGWLLVAVRASGPVGVDLEFPRTGVDPDRLAARVFTPTEHAALQRAAKESGAAAERWFFGCWTRKEALLKCLGTGFAGGASAFEVGAGPQTVRVPAPGHGHAAVRVVSLELPDLAAAAHPTGHGGAVPRSEEGYAAVAWTVPDPERPDGSDPASLPVATYRLEPAP